MKIQEIISLPSRDEPLINHQSNFDDVDGRLAFSGLIFKEVELNDEHHLGLFDDDVLIAYLRLDIRDLGLWQITYSLTEQQFRGNGCFRYLLEHAVIAHGKVLSDNHQTNEATNAWKSLIANPGGKMKITVLDVDSGVELAVDDERDIWNQQASPVLVASRIEYSAKVREHMERDDMLKKKAMRDHNSIWFGVNCCDSLNTL